jgi:type II secretion system-associated lipoprotein
MKMGFRVLLLGVFTCLSGCTTLLTDEDIAALGMYEKEVYRLKTDITTPSGKVYAKGSRVRLKNMSTSDFVKIYAYPADVSTLDADYALILYLFEEDFPREDGPVHEGMSKTRYQSMVTAMGEAKAKETAEYMQKQQSVDDERYRYSQEKVERYLNAVVEPVRGK